MAKLKRITTRLPRLKAPKPQPIDKGWTAVGSLSRMVIRPGSTSLALYAQQTPGVSDPLWHLVALETGADANSIEGVFDNHAHQVIAKDIASINDVVIRLGDRYVTKWLKKNAAAKACPCGPIKPDISAGIEAPVIPSGPWRTRRKEKIIYAELLPYEEEPKKQRPRRQGRDRITKATRGASKSVAKTSGQRKRPLQAPSGAVYFDADELDALKNVHAHKLIDEKKKRNRKRAG